MSTLIEHIIRMRLDAHARRFAGLPLTSVPSAAVTDGDIRQWSREMYDRDLDIARRHGDES